MQASTPPRSDRRAVGGVWSFAIAPPEPGPDADEDEASFVRFELLPPSAVFADRTLRFPVCGSG
jgi:hypothetical protein